MQPYVIAPHEDCEIVISSGDKFHVVIFGGKDEVYHQNGKKPPPVFFCVHGAGMCSSSFFVLATHLVQQQQLDSDSVETNPEGAPDIVRVVTYDMRCHGDSTFNGGEASLTLNVLVEDFRDVLTTVKKMFFPHTSHIYVAGHSLGGSVVAHGLSKSKEMIAMVAGVVLFDVVEGTSKVSLQYMDKFLQNRPLRFGSVEDATAWFLQHGGMTSPTAAEVTVPPMLKPIDDHYEWKSNLEAMSSVWSEWFNGLDDAFVNLPCPKILFLANAERLDVALTVAQMQGKFQFEVLGNGCGHYVMDDKPAVVVEKLRRFVRRIETVSEKLRFVITRTPTLATTPSRNESL